MRRPAYDPSALKTFLEEKIGRFVSFEMVMECSRPENYRVVTEAGERFLVKCVPFGRPGMDKFRERFLPNLQALALHSEAVKLVGGPWEFYGHVVVILSWCRGGRVMPDRLTERQRTELTRAYAVFSSAMQKTRAVLPARDCLAEREGALRALDRAGCRSLRDFVRREIPESSVTYESSRLKVIHGDFHHGNFHFEGDCVSGFMDFEEFRYGYPADDWARYVIVGAEHLRWFDRAGRRRLLDFFTSLLPSAPADEWRLAVNAFLIRKIFRRFSKKRAGLLKIWWARKLRFRLGFYRALQARIAAYERGENGNGCDIAR